MFLSGLIYLPHISTDNLFGCTMALLGDSFYALTNLGSVTSCAPTGAALTDLQSIDLLK